MYSNILIHLGTSVQPLSYACSKNVHWATKPSSFEMSMHQHLLLTAKFHRMFITASERLKDETPHHRPELFLYRFMLMKAAVLPQLSAAEQGNKQNLSINIPQNLTLEAHSYVFVDRPPKMAMASDGANAMARGWTYKLLWWTFEIWTYTSSNQVQQ